MVYEQKYHLTSEQLNQYHFIEELKNLASRVTLTETEMAQHIEMIAKAKEKLVCEIYFKNKKRKEFYTCKDGRVKSYHPQFIAPDREALIDKLYNYYFNQTLEMMYKKWMLRRREIKKVTNKTLEEYAGIWRRCYANTRLASQPVNRIEPKDLMNLFEEWTGNGLITLKDFTNRKGLLNGVFKYCVLEGVISRNPLQDLPYRDLKFKGAQSSAKTYTTEERKKLLTYIRSLPQDAYTLAIQLAFYSVLRVGEIKALRWEDQDFNRIFIDRQLVDDRTMNDDLTFNACTHIERRPKGNPYFSIRSETINDEGVKVLLKMKSINPDGKYLFLYEGRPLCTETFNRRLKKYCKAVGIEYRSSHKIRFTSASMCHLNGMDDTHIQTLLGHSTLRMTQHYLRPVTTMEQGVQMQDILR